MDWLLNEDIAGFTPLIAPFISSQSVTYWGREERREKRERGRPIRFFFFSFSFCFISGFLIEEKKVWIFTRMGSKDWRKHSNLQCFLRKTTPFVPSQSLSKVISNTHFMIIFFFRTKIRFLINFCYYFDAYVGSNWYLWEWIGWQFWSHENSFLVKKSFLWVF